MRQACKSRARSRFADLSRAAVKLSLRSSRRIKSAREDARTFARQPPAHVSRSLSLFLSLYRRSRVYDRSWDVNPRPRAWLTRLTCSLSLQNWTHRYDKRGLLSMYSENRAELTLAACRKVNIRDLKSVLRHDAQHSWPDDARTASKCSTFHVADKPECFPAATVRTGGGRMHPSHFDREGQPFRKNLSPAERVNFSSSQKKKKRMIIDATLAPSVH